MGSSVIFRSLARPEHRAAAGGRVGRSGAERIGQGWRRAERESLPPSGNSKSSKLANNGAKSVSRASTYCRRGLCPRALDLVALGAAETAESAETGGRGLTAAPLQSSCTFCTGIGSQPSPKSPVLILSPPLSPSQHSHKPDRSLFLLLLLPALRRNGPRALDASQFATSNPCGA
jgi:hypothetical protein